MTTDNPDPLEVWREACVAYGGLSIEGGEGERAAAAIIAQHYAPVIAENERLREALRRIVELDHHNMGPSSTSSNIARQALGAKP